MKLPALHESRPSLDEWRGPKYEAFSDHIALTVKGGKQRHGLRRPSFRSTATPISLSFLAFFLDRCLVTCIYKEMLRFGWVGEDQKLWAVVSCPLMNLVPFSVLQDCDPAGKNTGVRTARSQFMAHCAEVILQHDPLLCFYNVAGWWIHTNSVEIRISIWNSPTRGK